MPTPHLPSKHRGSVLVIGLVLLLVITVLAVATMSNTHMQERMAGNARMQALAFEVASAGASDALNFYLERKDGEGGLLELYGVCREPPGWTTLPGWVEVNSIGGEPITRVGDHDVSLQQRIYCIAEEYTDQPGVYPATAQLFVLSRGQVLSPANQVMAQRDIEVRIMDRLPKPLDSCTAICLPACSADPNLLRMPTAGAFQVDGSGGPAITTGSDACRDAVIAATQEEKLGNYVGGVASAEGTDDTLGWPWDSADQVEEFRAYLEALAKGQDLAGVEKILPDMRVDHIEGNFTPTGSTVVDLGSAGDPKLTYINGDGRFRGSDSGEGILVVRGNLEWAGTPEFTGLILVLGGQFTVKGGGTGGDFGGSLITVNLSSTATGTAFGDVALDFRGGGTADNIYNCEKLQEFSSAIYSPADPVIGSDWYPQCAGDPGDAGLVEAAAISWRENIGWRNLGD